jgi:hypothetical protein
VGIGGRSGIPHLTLALSAPEGGEGVSFTGYTSTYLQQRGQLPDLRDIAETVHDIEARLDLPRG